MIDYCSYNTKYSTDVTDCAIITLANQRDSVLYEIVAKKRLHGLIVSIVGLAPAMTQAYLI
jgi:hypothetical protein